MSVFGIILVRMRENALQNISKYGHFLRSDKKSLISTFACFLTAAAKV